MFTKFRASLLRWKLRREAKRDWLTLREYVEQDCHGNLMMAYVAEKNMLGERRLRVIWKRTRAYRPGSRLYVQCLLWADSRDAGIKVPEMDRV